MDREKELAKLRPLIEELSTALGVSMHDNINVFRAITKIKDLGYGVHMIAEFHIGIEKLDDDEPGSPQEVAPKVVDNKVVPGTFTADDEKKFSETFKITL